MSHWKIQDKTYSKKHRQSAKKSQNGIPEGSFFEVFLSTFFEDGYLFFEDGSKRPPGAPPDSKNQENVSHFSPTTHFVREKKGEHFVLFFTLFW